MMNGNPLAGLAELGIGRSFSLTPENPDGAPGGGARAIEGTQSHQARELGQGWKVNPRLHLKSGDTAVLADLDGSGTINHIWITPSTNLRRFLLRVWWDGQEHPSIQVPLGDFFGCGWGHLHTGANFRPLNSLPVTVNPGIALNCWWPMPFSSACRITIELLDDGGSDSARIETIYYQIDGEWGEVDPAGGRLHTQWRRSDPLPYGEVHTILDGVSGRGHYVGTSIAWGSRHDGWWGEGEVKFYLDGDGAFPTICGTGTEDYFTGSYNFDVGKDHGGYREFCTPYAGMHQVLRPDGLYRSQMRFSMYRWHLADPIRFQRDLRVTVQALGWQSGGRYLPLQDDIASTAFWYQNLPSVTPLPAPTWRQLQVV